MLLELYIKNLAIVEEARISFAEGINILTGETASGKSIIISAITLLCGARSNISLIGRYLDSAFIEGVFSLSDFEVDILRKKFLDLNLDISIEDNLLIVSRNLNKNGRSLSKINNRNINNSTLCQIMLNILNVCGQHDSYTLFNRNNFVDILDSFSDESFKIKLKKIEYLYDSIKKTTLKLKNIKKACDNFEENILELENQILELESLELEKLDEEKLENEIEKYSNSKNIIKSCVNLKELFNSETSDVNLFTLLSDISKNLTEIENDDKNFKLSEEFEGVSFEINDIFEKIENYYNGIYIDEETFLNLQEKFNLLNDLKKRYRKNKDELIKYKDVLTDRLITVKNSKDFLEETKSTLKKLKTDYIHLATEISSLRKKKALELEKMIEKELLDLDLKNSTFKINVISNNKITKIGFDDVDFLISTNKGEELKEISKVASGGEMSRIMLGFKKVLSEKDKIQTLIFDEIDTGISGITAQVVGKKLVEISNNRQLIVISHLPQIAIFSDRHFIIKKEILENKTVSKINIANKEDKVLEISRLISGSNINEITLKQSCEMIKWADSVKEKLRCTKK